MSKEGRKKSKGWGGFAVDFQDGTQRHPPQ